MSIGIAPCSLQPYMPDLRETFPETLKPDTLHAGPRVYGPRIRKLKQLCARATIKVPPSTYRSTKSEADIEEALLELLHKHKLGEDAKDHQLLRVKAKLEQARELEGKPQGLPLHA